MKVHETYRIVHVMAISNIFFCIIQTTAINTSVENSSRIFITELFLKLVDGLFNSIRTCTQAVILSS